mmetsp:Transcript_22950/g.48189  ORF Transcript_22950/g.48189 Transcript_22950/m.48189 type:complete len:278 (-) Transcript_22950:1849-2682(-)|eukprot:CAMPEP_0171373896 /NCGR_PEP_ID=MMETSP0879-20121228/13616_1 /TAXON_ID=67004 /ORGANISM="Thalassiosira weissflogii, Strain CCMP1336" /LENGTH=277 /DNA_ID=CAMNT_0011883121 /DNA_START=64 /DNA_END=897 /DNA_ORIENTATION=+
MEATRIGQPNQDVAGNNENKPRAVAPGIFSIPSQDNYDPKSGFVHCSIKRYMNDLYHLSFQIGDTETVAIVAKKVKSSLTSNYHIYDAIRGGLNTKLSKKAGHYIGKFRRDKDQRAGYYTLYHANREKEQAAAFVYDIPRLVHQVTDGQPPRKMKAVVPRGNSRTGSTNSVAAVTMKTSNVTEKSRLIEHLHNGTWRHNNLLALQTKAPVFTANRYRLDFNGRVLVPSVKNMQLMNEQGEILLQFGKVDKKGRFHLDYKAPFTAFSALGAALAQFDL